MAGVVHTVNPLELHHGKMAGKRRWCAIVVQDDSTALSSVCWSLQRPLACTRRYRVRAQGGVLVHSGFFSDRESNSDHLAESILVSLSVAQFSFSLTEQL